MQCEHSLANAPGCQQALAVTSLRTLLILGRVSNLPTVWSNCLAGWWLAGGCNTPKLPCLFGGVSALYLGGMFLNDAFDAEFDRQHRPERPIPSGAISLRSGWRYGFGFLMLGTLLLFACGLAAGIFGAVLALNVLAYDASHKKISFAPILMGACRFWVYLIGGAVACDGINGFVVWGGVALMVYVVGISFIARREAFATKPPAWPALLLAFPILLALAINTGPFREAAALLSLILGLWLLRSLRCVYWTSPPNPGRAVAALLAGIVFVDWLAVCTAPRSFGAAFVGLFLTARLFQRYVPAT